jgi:muconolactone delta-isomerase
MQIVTKCIIRRKFEVSCTKMHEIEILYRNARKRVILFHLWRANEWTTSLIYWIGSIKSLHEILTQLCIRFTILFIHKE